MKYIVQTENNKTKEIVVRKECNSLGEAKSEARNQQMRKEGVQYSVVLREKGGSTNEDEI